LVPGALQKLDLHIPHFGLILILFGLLTRLAAIPLLIIMIIAFISTKIPILMDKGFWSFAHEYRTDFAMTLLLIHILMYGGGNKSIDLQKYSSQRKNYG
jgi:putative oxidoreductase